MRGHTHLTIGIVTGLAMATAIHALPLQALGMGLAGALGAVLPDVDTPNSFISRRLWPTWIIRLLVKHRGFTHSLVANGLMFGLAYFLGGPFAWAMGLGYSSHIIADSMTINGVPLLHPLSHRCQHTMPRGLRLRTGGVVEHLFLWVNYAVLLVLIAGLTHLP